MLTCLTFNAGALIDTSKPTQITVQGHLTRGEYYTEKSLDALLAERVSELDNNEVLQLIAEEYDLETDEVADACVLLRDLTVPSDRTKLLNRINEDMLDAITDQTTLQVHSPEDIVQAVELFTVLPAWIRDGILNDQIDLQLIEAALNPDKAALMKKALGMTD